MGEFTFRIADITQVFVHGIDISPESIEVCQKTLCKHPNEKLSFEAIDAEKTPFKENTFDMICMSGSLAYLDLNLLLQNVSRWLKPNGFFIIVDTYGYNPFLNLKRRLNYWFKKGTLQTVLGIPKKSTIDTIRQNFEYMDIRFSGIFAGLGPFLRYLIGDRLTAKFIDKCDDWFPFLQKYAFKFALCAQNPKK